MIDAAEHPLCIRHQFEQAEANAISRRSMDGESLLAARLDANAMMPCHGVAHAGLRCSGSGHSGLAEDAGRIEERGKAGRLDAIVICEEQFQAKVLSPFLRLFQPILATRRSDVRFELETRKPGTSWIDLFEENGI
jgi:hypothetical protein